MNDFRAALKPAVYTAAFTAVPPFLLVVLAWLGSVSVWAAGGGEDPFPSAGVLVFALVGLVVGLAGAVVNFAVRYLQARQVLPGDPPVYVERSRSRRRRT